MKKFEVTKVVVIKTFITAESADDAIEIAEELTLDNWRQEDQIGDTDVTVYPYKTIRDAEGLVRLVKEA